MIKFHPNTARAIVYNVILALFLAFRMTIGRLTDPMYHYQFEVLPEHRECIVERTAQVDLQHVLNEKWQWG